MSKILETESRDSPINVPRQDDFSHTNTQYSYT